MEGRSVQGLLLAVVGGAGTGEAFEDGGEVPLLAPVLALGQGVVLA